MTIKLIGTTGAIGSELNKLIHTEHRPEEIVINATGRDSRDPEKAIADNIIYLENILSQYADKQIHGFVHFSTYSVNNLDDKLAKDIRENSDALALISKLDAQQIYPACKLYGEVLVREYSRHFPCLILRLPAVLTQKSTNILFCRWIEKAKASGEVNISKGKSPYNHFVTPENIYQFVAQYSFNQQLNIIDLGSLATNTLSYYAQHICNKYNAKLISNDDPGSIPEIDLDRALAFGYKAEDPERSFEQWLQLQE